MAMVARQVFSVFCLLLFVAATNQQLPAPPPPQFAVPKSEGFDHVNMMIGNGGFTPGGSGGMIPATGPPFAMTRWIAQTNPNYVSKTPYNWTGESIHGVQATRQPAIWMGESGSVAVIPGISRGESLAVKTNFADRGLAMRKETQVMTPSYYSIALDDGFGGKVLIEQSSTSRVGHLRFTFTPQNPLTDTPFIILESARPSVITNIPTNISFPDGTVNIILKSPSSTSTVHEICGSNSERQDRIITPVSTAQAASGFRGYYCARFDLPPEVSRSGTLFGVVQNSNQFASKRDGEGPSLSGYVAIPFPKVSSRNASMTISVRIGTSFISIDQARRNIDLEIPDANSNGKAPSLESTARKVREAWIEKLDRIQIEFGPDANQTEVAIQKEVFWTGVMHALQYPYEQHEIDANENGVYYSAYDNKVHQRDGGESYTGYSIWDTYRAEWAFLILMAPERLPGMVRSMLNDYVEGGRLPMWKNIAETNIMVGTHADSLIAEAVVKGVQGFDKDLAWEAVWKDATVPPVDDNMVVYSDRQENVDYEARAGLSTSYATEGWVANDIHSESASRTLDYAYDDYAAYKLGMALKKPGNVTSFLLERALRSAFVLYNNETGFMEAKNADGSWSGPAAGFTEGDKWTYTFDVIHDVPGLIARRGGNQSFIQSMDDYFDGGHNNHPNEASIPSHHIPYLYSLAGGAAKTQTLVRQIAHDNYNNTIFGLSGNDDCGQMSAWYIFSAMGFYPVNPASGEYIIGSPFFDKIIIDLPSSPLADGKINANGPSKKLTITAKGAATRPFIKSLKINGRDIDSPVIRHEDIANGGDLVFEMSDKMEAWGNGALVN